MKIKYITIKLKDLAAFSLILFIFISTLPVYPQSVNTESSTVIELNDTAVNLVYKDTLILPSFIEFELAVKMKKGFDVSAISLGFYFPEEFLEIMDIELSQVEHGYTYNIKDSLFRLAWSNIYPISFSDDDTLLILKMKTLDITALEGTIKLQVYELSEFADEFANPIQDVVLEIPEIKYLIPDTNDSVSGSYISVYPNPFKEFTAINFSLKQESNVKITICNTSGIEMKQVTDSVYSPGAHQIRLYALDLAKGVYLLKFEIRNSETSGSKIIKILSIG